MSQSYKSLRSYKGSGNNPAVQLEFLSTTVPQQAFLFSDILGDISFYDCTHRTEDPSLRWRPWKHLSLLVPSWRKGQPRFPRTFHGDSATDLKSSTMSGKAEKWRMNFFHYQNKFPSSLPLPLYFFWNWYNEAGNIKLLHELKTILSI